jgi:hypothetical protein
LTGDASSVDQDVDSLIAEIAGVAVMNYGKYVKKVRIDTRKTRKELTSDRIS